MSAVCRRLDWVLNKYFGGLLFVECVEVQLNRTNSTRLNSKHANTNQRTHPDGSGGPLIHYTNASNAVQIIVHYTIFFYLLLKMVALNNSRPWVTSDDRFSMPLLEIAVQNQERSHCRSKTRFIGLQHVTESTLHNQS